MRVGGLFSGIGGFELGLVRAGFEIAWMVEIDSFCQKVLRKHAPVYWPNAEIFGDIKNVGKHNLKPVDLICGGFPCQPFSSAGKQLGETDDRHVWPEMLRAVQELKPTWVIGENVTGFVDIYLDYALSDLEAEGYETCPPLVFPACGFGAPHKRDRVFILAHAESRRESQFQASDHRYQGGRNTQEQPRTRAGGRGSDGSATKGTRRFQPVTAEVPIFMGDDSHGLARRDFWKIEPAVGRMANGIPHRVDRLGSLGNAVVPQIPEILGRMIQEIERAMIAQEVD